MYTFRPCISLRRLQQYSTFRVGHGRGIDQEAWRKFCGAQLGVDLDWKYRKMRTRDNNYLQDRQAMKLGDFTGILGIPMQDMAMWETMGPIADRGRERLGASDLATSSSAASWWTR